MCLHCWSDIWWPKTKVLNLIVILDRIVMSSTSNKFKYDAMLMLTVLLCLMSRVLKNTQVGTISGLDIYLL